MTLLKIQLLSAFNALMHSLKLFSGDWMIIFGQNILSREKIKKLKYFYFQLLSSLFEGG